MEKALDLCVTHRLYAYIKANDKSYGLLEEMKMGFTRATMMAFVIFFASFSVMADSGHGSEEAMAGAATNMPMASGQMPMMGGNMGNMPMMQMMQERHAMMQAHMQKMETHMANIEALLEQLVELQKRK